MDSRSISTRTISIRPFRVRRCVREDFGSCRRAYGKWLRVIGAWRLLVTRVTAIALGTEGGSTWAAE